jgi:hypothetical protein
VNAGVKHGMKISWSHRRHCDKARKVLKNTAAVGPELKSGGSVRINQISEA